MFVYPKFPPKFGEVVGFLERARIALLVVGRWELKCIIHLISQSLVLGTVLVAKFVYVPNIMPLLTHESGYQSPPEPSGWASVTLTN